MKTLHNTPSILTVVRAGSAIVISACLSMGIAHAQTAATSIRADKSPAEIDAFWTPTRVLNAEPMENRLKFAPKRVRPGTELATDDPTPREVSSGAAPTVAHTDADMKVLVPATYLDQKPTQKIDASQLGPDTDLKLHPDATTPNSLGAVFTTSRVFPDIAADYYPYLTAGKLFFHDPRLSKDFVCSASVLRQRVVVTAGHCVTKASTDASQRYFYTNFVFIPAYQNGAGPVGSFTPNFLWVANEWFLSDGSVPNAQDVAMLIMNDRGVNKIWAYTGYLGYRTGALSSNNVTMLGYPVNLDNGERMQSTNAQTLTYGGNNTYIYGSSMAGGASGGPWVQDFGVNPTGTSGTTLGQNLLVSVTSYGPVAGPGYLGGSTLDSRFIGLLNLACAGTGNCSN